MSDLNFINDLAKENGFSVVGITNAKTSKLTQTRLDEFIQNKYHANLKWLEDKKEIRKSPKILWPDAKSAIIFGFISSSIAAKEGLNSSSSKPSLFFKSKFI